jgi:hypothetical protein
MPSGRSRSIPRRSGRAQVGVASALYLSRAGGARPCLCAAGLCADAGRGRHASQPSRMPALPPTGRQRATRRWRRSSASRRGPRIRATPLVARERLYLVEGRLAAALSALQELFLLGAGGHGGAVRRGHRAGTPGGGVMMRSGR